MITPPSPSFDWGPLVFEKKDGRFSPVFGLLKADG